MLVSRATIVAAMLPGPAAPTPQRLRVIQIATVVILILAFSATILILFNPERRAEVEALISSPAGLLALFLLSTLSSATLILPVPGFALTAIAATAGNPLIVGIVGGAGQALGEMTGYLAGYSGQELIDSRPRYGRMVNWMRRYGGLTIFVLALIPNPFFDVAGIVAGALRMPWWLYLLTAGAGKILRNIALAYAVATGADWLLNLFPG